MRELHAFIREKFDTVDCKMIMLEKSASSKVACAWDKWAVNEELEFGRLWDALDGVFGPLFGRKVALVAAAGLPVTLTFWVALGARNVLIAAETAT